MLVRLAHGLSAIKRVLRRGVFPHEFSWLLDLHWRRLLLSPEVLASRLGLSAGACVLELGSGSGYYSVEVVRRLHDGALHLYDVQPEMIAQCRAKCDAAQIAKAGFTVGDAVSLPYKDATFDIVFMVAVLGEIPDSAACLAECRRILKADALLSISEHLPDPDFIPFPTLRRRTEDAGFRLERFAGRRFAFTANFRKQ